MIFKQRKYCAGRSLAYPLMVLDFFVDIYSKFFYRNRKREAINFESPKFLILSNGHLGDALILTYIFPKIKEKYSNAKIDLVVGDWCLEVLKSNQYINKIHIINHAKTNRKRISSWQKWKDFYQTTRQTIQNLNQENYDFSIDIRFANYPLHFILPFIRVKKTMGFGTRGFGGLLDEEFFMEENDVHHLEYIKPLFKSTGVDFAIENLEPYFFQTEEIKLSFEEKFKKLNIQNQRFILFFPEAGEEHRMLPIRFWKELSEEILEKFEGKILVCGQSILVDEIAENIGIQAVALRNTFKINELSSLNQKAEKVFCLDSFPIHLSCIETKSVCFSKDTLGIIFFPINNKPTLYFHNHKNSIGKPFSRKGFTAKYIEKFDNQIIKEAAEF